MTDLSIATQNNSRDEIFSRNENRLQLSRLFHNWRARGAIKALADHDDNMLRDIGITRDEISWAAKLPLTINSAIALNDRALRRRSKEF